MAGHSMEVDASHLHAGADRCGDAAGTSLSTAHRLAREVAPVGMFGDFAQAHALHQAVSAAHQAHVEQLQDHHRALIDIAEKGRIGAQEFTARDVSSADTLRSAEAGFGMF